MKQVKVMNTEKELIDKLIGEFNGILSFEHNEAAKKDWLTVTKNLKPKTCNTKVGWISDKYISFDCQFSLDGHSDVLEAIAKGIKPELLEKSIYFINELMPYTFYFNPAFTHKEANHFYMSFKLVKNSKNGK